MAEATTPPIDVYEHLDAVCHDYDPRVTQVAARVAELVSAIEPDLIVEHIGSTAVPGLAGKGVVDLMLLYPEGGLERAKTTLDQLGFQRQSTRDPFPESRPMRVGSLVFDDKMFRLHVHVIAADAEEVTGLRRLRDGLCNDPALRVAYVARKRAILDSGVRDQLEYSNAKQEFIQAALGALSE